MRFQVGDKVKISSLMKEQRWYGNRKNPINEVGEIENIDSDGTIFVKWENADDLYSECMLKLYRRP